MFFIFSAEFTDVIKGMPWLPGYSLSVNKKGHTVLHDSSFDLSLFEELKRCKFKTTSQKKMNDLIITSYQEKEGQTFIQVMYKGMVFNLYYHIVLTDDLMGQGTFYEDAKRIIKSLCYSIKIYRSMLNKVNFSSSNSSICIKNEFIRSGTVYTNIFVVNSLYEYPLFNKYICLLFSSRHPFFDQFKKSKKRGYFTVIGKSNVIWANSSLECRELIIDRPLLDKVGVVFCASSFET